MRLLILDTEQTEVMLIAAEAAASLLRARAKRVDPDGLLSKAAELQETKLEQIRHQLERPSPLAWPEIATKSQEEIMRAARVFIAEDAPGFRDHAWPKLLAAVINRAHRQEVPASGADNGPGPEEGVAALPPTANGNHTRDDLRSMPDQTGDASASHSTHRKGRGTI